MEHFAIVNLDLKIFQEIVFLFYKYHINKNNLFLFLYRF